MEHQRGSEVNLGSEGSPDYRQINTVDTKSRSQPFTKESALEFIKTDQSADYPLSPKQFEQSKSNYIAEEGRSSQQSYTKANYDSNPLDVQKLHQTEDLLLFEPKMAEK